MIIKKINSYNFFLYFDYIWLLIWEKCLKRRRPQGYKEIKKKKIVFKSSRLDEYFLSHSIAILIKSKSIKRRWMRIFSRFEIYS